MFEYLTTEDYPVKVQQGVIVTLRKPCNSLRDRLVLKTAVSRNDLRSMLKEIDSIQADDLAAAQDLDCRVRLKHKEVLKTYFTECVVNVAGMTIDGKIPDAELLFDLGNEDLVMEIKERIDSYLGLSAEEQKNLELPTTSGEPVIVTTNDTTARFAETKDISASETA